MTTLELAKEFLRLREEAENGSVDLIVFRVHSYDYGPQIARGFVVMWEALEKAKNDLIESGSYIVEDGFEEPSSCKMLRDITEALEKAGAGK